MCVNSACAKARIYALWTSKVLNKCEHICAMELKELKAKLRYFDLQHCCAHGGQSFKSRGKEANVLHKLSMKYGHN